MKRMVLMAATVLLLLPGIVCSEQSPESQSLTQGVATQQQQQQKQQQQIAQGELAKVDSQKHLLWIETPDGRQTQFSYNNQTKVQGAGDTVEALASMSGHPLKVHFQDQGGAKMAVLIEVEQQSSRQGGQQGTRQGEQQGSGSSKKY